MNDTLTLYVSDLASKFGFGDGDLISDFCSKNDIDTYYVSYVDILVTLVESELIPLVPGDRFYFMDTCHNPIRCEAEYLTECSTSLMSVELTKDEVIAAIRKLTDKAGK